MNKGKGKEEDNKRKRIMRNEKGKKGNKEMKEWKERKRDEKISRKIRKEIDI